MKKKQNGVALIEFALILPLLLILTFITTEFGRALYQYNTIAKSLRDASRYLSTQDPSIATTDPAKITIAKNLVVFGNPVDNGSPLVLGLSTSQVPTPTWQFKGSAPAINTVTIKVTGYKFRPLITGVFGLTFGDANGDIPFGDISATMRGQS
ncbi:TadE family protein [Variovorax paradoxus]|uniref:Flp pilus assembly protein TadG n=1 Tax=Variovorax paradoxus TaxID=34073 RepID=A0AAW8EFG4_VARPD|nr:TadE family protein [Variovorax paradoxus]MDP9971289.1 Flp pilus assembly protein TadG [Variovorax paradoxus]